MRGVLAGQGVPDGLPLPDMTSDSAPAGYTSSCSTLQGGAAWWAFDGGSQSLGSATDVVSNSGPTYPWNLNRSLPAAKKVFTYRLKQHGGSSNTNWPGLGSPVAWTIQGSNDGSSWVVIDTRTAQTIALDGNTLYNITNPGYYAHYRMAVTQSGTSNQYVIISELIYYT